MERIHLKGGYSILLCLPYFPSYDVLKCRVKTPTGFGSGLEQRVVVASMSNIGGGGGVLVNAVMFQYSRLFHRARAGKGQMSSYITYIYFLNTS